MDQSLLDLIRGGADPTNFTPNTVVSTLKLIQKFLIYLAAFESVVGLSLAGFQYFTAYGDEAKAGQAKKTMYWVLIGAIVIILANVIVYETERIVIGAEPPPVDQLTEPFGPNNSTNTR